MSNSPLVRRSKHLSLVLRHDPASVGLTLDKAGWVPVDKLLDAMKMTREQLGEIVERNDKKRFELSADGMMIRASQGHSVDVNLGYEQKVPPERLFHGTSADWVPSILKTGLGKRERHHVHLSADEGIATIVARRRRNPVVLRIKAAEMAKEGHKFFLSTNGVWLTDAVPPVFIEWPMLPRAGPQPGES